MQVRRVHAGHRTAECSRFVRIGAACRAACRRRADAPTRSS